MTRNRLSNYLILAAACLLLAVAGCGASSGQLTTAPGGDPQAPAQDTLSGFGLALLKSVSGAPSGVRVSWPRVDDAEVSGYYIYRDTSALPTGDPAGSEALRINSGNKIAQSGSGTDTLTFDDNFSPDFGDTFHYRLTVVNQTDDESDFSDELQITIAEHTVTGVSQAGGSIGDEVTITGTHFGQDRSGDEVFFTDADGDTVVAAGASDYVSWTPTQIVVQIPYGAADGVVGVEVDGVTVLSVGSIDYNEPTLTNLNPVEDRTQNGYITLTGTDFGPPPSTVGNQTKVFFGTVEAQPADFDEGAWTTTEIQVKVPAGSFAGLLDVRVSVAGNESGTQPFTVLPYLDSINPTFGSVGSSVTLSGTSFGTTQGSSLVRIRGFIAPVTSWSDTSVTVTVPAAATDGNVVLIRGDGKSTAPLGYDVVPTISGFSPVRRMVDEVVTITGSGFGGSPGASQVVFVGGGDEVTATDYLSWSASEISVRVPGGAKHGKLRVEVADNSVGANLDSVESTGSVVILLPPPVIDDTGQL